MAALEAVLEEIRLSARPFNEVLHPRRAGKFASKLLPHRGQDWEGKYRQLYGELDQLIPEVGGDTVDSRRVRAAMERVEPNRPGRSARRGADAPKPSLFDERGRRIKGRS